jgi:OFA family oxalate/formate antiporter-like MFS transporter
MTNRFTQILLPGILLPMSLGTVYNFSQYSANIQQLFDISKFQGDIGFMLIIFFLGMGAAVFGRMVEMNPKKMAVVSTVLFSIGMLALFAATSLAILPLYYIACIFMGTGTGIGYTAPIKQLVANFQDHAGLCSGLAITGFGTGKFVFAPIIEYLLNNFTLPNVFLILSGIFLVIMSLCSWLYKPNPNYISTKYTAIPYKVLVKDKFLTKEYISVWFMFFINITCGLALISQEKGLFLNAGYTAIATLMAATAIANVGGRFGMSTASDYIGRKAAYHWVASLGILGAFLCYTQNPVLLVIGVLMIEWNYGGGFSCLPSLLAKRFGSSCLSTVHSMTLSAWGFAGIAGPTLGNLFTDQTLYLVLALLYFIGFLGFTIFVKRDTAQ